MLIKYMNSKFLSHMRQCNFKHDLPRQAAKALRNYLPITEGGPNL